MFSFRMRTKISFFLVVIVIIPIAILGYFSLVSQDEQVDGTLKGMNLGFSELIAYQIYGLITGSRAQVEWLASVPAVQRFDKARLQGLLERFVRLHPAFEGVGVFDRAKRLVCKHGRFADVGDTKFLFGTALFDRYGGGGQAAPAESGAGDAQPRLKQPIYTEDGELAGVVVATLSREQLSRTLEEILEKLSRTYEFLDIYVLDENERPIIANKGAIYADRRYFPVEKEQANWHRKYIRDFYSYETPNWSIVTIPRPTARGSLDRMMRFLKNLFFWTIVGASLVGLLFAGTITYPLRELVESAVTISKGDLSQPVEVHTGDEIGELADKFDLMRVNLKKMQDSLRAKIAELETLYRMGKAISSTLDFQELLEIVLEMIVRTTAAHRASIMLLDDKTEELRIQLAHGLSEEVIAKTRVRLGERVSGHVLQTGRPLLIYDTFKSPNFANLKDGRIAAGTLMSVPLIAKEKRLGVLNVSRSVPYSFSDRDLELISALANQAAMAIDNARLYTLAITDELTKLYIRRFFLQRLQEEMRRARRYRGLLTVMILDIDHFKRFNDTYGHQAGDEVLIFVSRTMDRCVRRVDIVSRLGGEEFAILCPEQSVEEARVPAERIRRSIEQASLELGAERVKVQVTVSIGLADYPIDAEDQHDLIDKADQALYHAKNTGRNRVVCFRETVGGGEEVGEEPPCCV